MEDFLFFFLIGFAAQLVDAALGMAYGLISTTFLLNFGLPPMTASAVTHAAECITAGISGIFHHQLGNVNRQLFFRLVIPGILGAIAGVLLLTHVEAHIIKPVIAVYLLVMGCIVISKAFIIFPPVLVTSHLTPLGFGGAFMDAIGGGGWGAIVTSTLLARGHQPRTTIGSVTACGFFIATTASVTFFFNHAAISWQAVAALAVGGAIAAPMGAFLCKHAPVKVLLFCVGLLIIGLSCRILWLSFISLTTV
jgi:uncharacterized protein